MINLDKLVFQRIYLMMFKHQIGDVPKPISDLFQTNNNYHSYGTRSSQSLRTIYQTFTYIGVLAWNYNFTLTAMKKIKIAYNNSIRRLFFLPKHNNASEMCVNLNIMSFGELLRKYVYSFRLRLGASLNCIIDNIYSSNVPLHSDICSWWHSILNV